MKNIITFIFTLKIFDFEDFYVRYNFKQKEKFVKKAVRHIRQRRLKGVFYFKLWLLFLFLY